MKVDRRSFLSFVIGGAAGTALSPLPWKLMDDSSIWTQMWPWTPVPPDGEVSYVNTTSPLCSGGCGVSVRMVDNRAVKIEGQAGHPINDGGGCILCMSSLQMLYGPTRIKAPMKRVGERGEGKWKKISWDEATAILVEKLGDIRAKGEAHTVAAVSGSDYGTVPALLKRFMTAYGSPNFLRMPSNRDVDELAVKTLFGSYGRTGYDLENADYVLSFGSGIVDGWGSSARMLRACSTWRDKETTVVQIEPRLSNSAIKATQWVPINPGTEADLALGIAAVMVSRGWADSGDLSGFQSWKNDLQSRFTPKNVSQTTGVSADVIIQLAKGFGSARRPVAFYGRGKGLTASSLREATAIITLNALGGIMNREGGMVAVPEADYINWPDADGDQPALASLAQPRFDGAGAGQFADTRSLLNRMADGLDGSGPYPLQALLVAEANPCFELPDSKRVKEALGKIPFIVSFSTFADETAAMADLLMPNHFYLERFEDVPVAAGLPLQMIGLSKPVVSPQLNTRHLGETLITTARTMGGALAAAFPWPDYETCLEATLAEKWDVLMEDGVWVNDDIVPVGDKVALAKLDLPAVQAEGDVNGFPLLLVPYDSIRIAGGATGTPPFMIKTVADTVIKGHDGFVEINPRTAAAAGLAEGDKAVLTTPRGQAEVNVHLYEGIMPGILAMVRGLGHTAFDEYLADKGVNINELVGPVEDPSSGLDAAWGIRAKLDKA
jgi:anaerobic selenocysteine-containing dehydrogenase